MNVIGTRLLKAAPLGLAACLMLGAVACSGGGTDEDTGKSNGEMDAGGTDESDGSTNHDASTGDGGGKVGVATCGSSRSGGGDAGMADAGATGGGGEPLPGDFSFDSQYEMRFTSFEFTEESPGSAANGFLEQFFDQSKSYPIVVLMHMKRLDPDAGTLRMRGGAGLKVDTSAACDEECQYKWDPMSPDEYYSMSLNAETGSIRGGLDKLDFVGTTEFANGDVEKFVLPIRDLIFTDAHLRPDDGSDEVLIENGRLEGFVTLEAAEKAKVRVSSGSQGVKISALLQKDRMNYDSNGDGELDSWCLQANFSASETTIAE